MLYSNIFLAVIHNRYRIPISDPIFCVDFIFQYQNILRVSNTEVTSYFRFYGYNFTIFAYKLKFSNLNFVIRPSFSYFEIILTEESLLKHPLIWYMGVLNNSKNFYWPSKFINFSKGMTLKSENANFEKAIYLKDSCPIILILIKTIKSML